MGGATSRRGVMPGGPHLGHGLQADLGLLSETAGPGAPMPGTR